jgi:hypothetical protein
MRITWNELTISPAGVDFDDLLSDWRWLVGEEYQPVVISALGDLFLRHDDGRIFWLNTGWGQLTEVAESGEEFKKLMVQPNNAAEWFIPNLVGDLLSSGKKLGGRVLQLSNSAGLGGEINPDNFEPTSLSVHFSVLGQIHEQVKDLPEGTPIGEIKIREAKSPKKKGKGQPTAEASMTRNLSSPWD